MLKILDLYIGRTLLTTTFLSLSVLVGLSALIQFVEQLRKVGQGDFDLVVAGLYVVLSIPRDIEQFFPMAVLLGGLIGLGMLASNSELIVMQSAGQSRWNIAVSAMKTALLMVVFIIALGEWVAPVAESKAKELRTQAISGGSLFSTDQLIWAKDGEKFVSIEEVLSRDDLLNVRIYEFDDALRLTSLIVAKSARFDGKNWLLNSTKTTWFEPNRIRIQEDDYLFWESSITPDKLGVVTVKPEALSIRGLSDYIGYLKNSSQNTDRYELARWRKLVQPFSVAVMLLTALSFIFGPLRNSTMGARIISGILMGFGFFITNEVFGPLSLVYQLPPIVGAGLPSVLFLVFAAILLRR